MTKNDLWRIDLRTRNYPTEELLMMEDAWDLLRFGQNHALDKVLASNSLKLLRFDLLTLAMFTFRLSFSSSSSQSVWLDSFWYFCLHLNIFMSIMVNKEVVDACKVQTRLMLFKKIIFFSHCLTVKYRQTKFNLMLKSPWHQLVQRDSN